MKTREMIFFLFLIFLMHSVKSQWTLVWSDEFDGNSVNTSNWTFDIGTGSNGWGNNELQYYRSENATVINGNLQITGKHESYGGMSYTSARLKTEGKVPVGPYGKIEARILAPSFMGSWPAFWMLGTNFGSIGWPACGEIDIMEHVNTESSSHAAIHWIDHNNFQANYSGSTSNDVTSWHVYSLEWDASYLRWFIDGQEYFAADISNNINGTDEFHNSFFIILNLAIGGNWPGFTIDQDAFPAKLLIDYVRVYGSDSSGGGDSSGSKPATACSGSENDYSWSLSKTTIEFNSNIGSSWADAHYTIDEGGQQNVRMVNKGNGNFSYTVNTNEGSTISVWFTYNKADGLAYNSKTHKCTVGGASINALSIGSTTSYTVGAEENSSTVVLKSTNFQSGQIMDNQDLSQVEVYPVPFDQELFINLNGVEGVQAIELFNTVGQLVASVDKDKIKGQFIKLTVNNSPGNTYILRIKNEQGIIVKSVIKK